MFDVGEVASNMTRNAVAIRHVQFEDLGFIRRLLKQAGFQVHIIDAGTDDLLRVERLEPSLLISLGGPISANDDNRYPVLIDEVKLLERRLASNRPTLGICLGAQLMARALGARVFAGQRREIGWSSIDLTREGRTSPLRHVEGVSVLHWHGDTFDLPHGAVRLASTPACENQAFAHGSNQLALQFHCEVDAARIEHWIIGHAFELAASAVDLAVLRADSDHHGEPLKVAGSAVFREWLAGLDDPQATENARRLSKRVTGRSIMLKRAYESPSADDGTRVLVDRLWPRGVKKADASIDHWLRELSPSTELRKWFSHDPVRWPEFRRRFAVELRQHADQLDQLRALARQGRVTLVYAARDEKHNDAVVLRQVLLGR
jgi:GMP synthase (glutamine-hydrolysing)